MLMEMAIEMAGTSSDISLSIVLYFLRSTSPLSNLLPPRTMRFSAILSAFALATVVVAAPYHAHPYSHHGGVSGGGSGSTGSNNGGGASTGGGSSGNNNNSGGSSENGGGVGYPAFCGLRPGQVSALTPLVSELKLSQTVDDVKRLVKQITDLLGDTLQESAVTSILSIVDNLVAGLGLGGLNLKPTVDSVTSILYKQVPCLLDTLLPKP